jgi:hypothetical protein
MLYNADRQYAMAQQSFINLPIGKTEWGPVGAIEVKAAWKILTPDELNAKPIRFHTAQALIAGQSAPVTVGLVGLHMIQRASPFYQGLWATFAQVDNAPLEGNPPNGSYSFFNPACAASACPVNTETKPPTPTQVEQVFAVPGQVSQLNSQVQQMIAAADPQSPWQFYQLLDVQWPTSAVPTEQPGQKETCQGGTCTGLPNGSPNINTLMNPVLETYLQVPNMSCLGCHTLATAAPVAADQNPQYLTSYSFLMGHAQSPAAP